MRIIKGNVCTPEIASGVNVIGHVVNDVGAFGKGVAAAIATHYPEAKDHYREWFAVRGHGIFGNILFTHITRTWTKEFPLYIVHIAAQRGLPSSHNRHPMCPFTLRDCLDRLGHIDLGGTTTFHFPKLGCGYGGGDWEIVRGIIARLATFHPVKVYEL